MTKRATILALCLTTCLSLAQTPATAPTKPVADPPTGLATGKTHKVVVAVTSGDKEDWDLALGNIRNLFKALDPDPVQVEVVSYGPGIAMIKADSTAAELIATLQAKGVKFVACQNSMRARHLELKDLLPGLTPVPAGIAEVVLKQEQGWVYIKGGR